MTTKLISELIKPCHNSLCCSYVSIRAVLSVCCSEMLITRTSRLLQCASYSYLLLATPSRPARRPVPVFTGLDTGFIRPNGQATNHSTKQTEISETTPIKFQDIKSEYTVRPFYHFSEDGGCHSMSRGTQPSYGIQAPSYPNGNRKHPVRMLSEYNVEQDRLQCTYNVTFRRVRPTIVVVEKQ